MTRDSFMRLNLSPTRWGLQLDRAESLSSPDGSTGGRSKSVYSIYWPFKAATFLRRSCDSVIWMLVRALHFRSISQLFFRCPDSACRRKFRAQILDSKRFQAFRIFWGCSPIRFSAIRRTLERQIQSQEWKKMLIRFPFTPFCHLHWARWPLCWSLSPLSANNSKKKSPCKVDCSERSG